MEEHYSLSTDELEALKELGNIGIGNAAIALSKILDKKVNMSIPDTSFIPITTFSDHFGGPDSIVMTIFSPILGELSGETLFIFSQQSGKGLVDLMMGNEPGNTVNELDEMGESAFKEMANIFVGTYLNAISDMMNIKLLPGVPIVATDMVESILNIFLLKNGEYADNILCSKANISIDGHKVDGDFIFLFDLESLQKIVKKIKESYGDLVN
ncbi:MAG: chemotaxis protein CheC [Nanoarchaeota archaeon]